MRALLTRPPGTSSPQAPPPAPRWVGGSLETWTRSPSRDSLSLCGDEAAGDLPGISQVLVGTVLAMCPTTRLRRIATRAPASRRGGLRRDSCAALHESRRHRMLRAHDLRSFVPVTFLLLPGAAIFSAGCAAGAGDDSSTAETSDDALTSDSLAVSDSASLTNGTSLQGQTLHGSEYVYLRGSRSATQVAFYLD